MDGLETLTGEKIMAPANVTVLGTGLMGAPMVRNLLKSGHSVQVWNRTLQKAQALARYGAKVHALPQEAVAGSDFVITMVSDGSAVEELVFGTGVADAMTAGSILVDMSSIKASEARDHAGRLEAMGLEHLDAPVSGGTRGAEAASLAIMAGGKKAVFDRAKPVMEAMGRAVHVGPAGAGQLAKLANQAIVAVTIGVVAEAMLLAEKGGAKPAAIRDALKGGFADSIILQQHGERMTTGNFDPGGKSATQLKDIENALEAARAVGLTLPLTEQMRERYATLAGEMEGGALDHSAIYLELVKRNGA